jgi:hypothetical protein
VPFKKWLRAYEPSIFPEFYHEANTGKLIERTWTIYPAWLNFQNGAYFGYSFTPTYQYLSTPFEPLGVVIKEGKYNYIRSQIYASTNPSKIINIQTIYNWGSYFNGILRSGEWTLQIAPKPHISILGKFNRNRFIRVGDSKTSTTIDLYAIEGRFALNPRLQLIMFYQNNAGSKSSNYNIRFSWEYKPLSYVYLVLNRREFQNYDFKYQISDQSIIKLSYLKQF